MPRLKSDELPGVEGEGVSPQKPNKALEAAITEWRDVVGKRQKLTEKEVATKAEVDRIMHADGIRRYLYEADDEDVREVVLEETVKYRRPKKTDDDDDDENGDNE